MPLYTHGAPDNSNDDVLIRGVTIITLFLERNNTILFIYGRRNHSIESYVSRASIISMWQKVISLCGWCMAAGSLLPHIHTVRLETLRRLSIKSHKGRLHLHRLWSSIRYSRRRKKAQTTVSILFWKESVVVLVRIQSRSYRLQQTPFPPKKEALL